MAAPRRQLLSDPCPGIQWTRTAPCAYGAEEDASDLAKQALQLVWRIGARATVAYVVDVFRGSKSANISRVGHDRLQGAGAGNHLT